MAVLVSRRPTLPDASFTVPAVSLVPDLFKSLLSDRFKSLFGPHQRYVIITEKGIHNFVTHEHVARGTGLSELSDEGEARGFVASLRCNWVLYRVEGSVYTEIDAGGIGLARPSIRWYVENELAAASATKEAATSTEGRTQLALLRGVLDQLFGILSPPVPENYVVVTENGIHNFEPSTHTDEGEARGFVARLRCNWVLYRVEGGVYTEIDAGGIGLARPSIRWYVENELAPSARCAERLKGAGGESSGLRWSASWFVTTPETTLEDRPRTPEELSLEELLEACAQLGTQPPSAQSGARYLKEHEGHVAKAAVAYAASSRWREEEGIHELLRPGALRLANPTAEAALEHAMGPHAMQVLCHDLEGRPVIFYDLRALDVPALLAKGVSQRDIVRRYLRWMELVVQEVDRSACPSRGHLAVYEVREFEPLRFFSAIPFWTEVAKVSKAHYPQLLGACLVMGAPAIGAWVVDHVLTKLIDRQSMGKVRLVASDPAKALVDGRYLTAEQVQQLTPYGKVWATTTTTTTPREKGGCEEVGGGTPQRTGH